MVEEENGVIDVGEGEDDEIDVDEVHGIEMVAGS